MADTALPETVDDAPLPESSDSGGRVLLRDKEGNKFSIPSSEMPWAKEQGYSVIDGIEQTRWQMDQKAKETWTDEVGAIAAGTARGITFGLSDLIATKTGLVEPETLKAWERQHPWLSGVTEYGSMIASSFLSGGVGLAGKVAGFTVGGIAAKTGAKVGKLAGKAVLSKAEQQAAAMAAKQVSKVATRVAKPFKQKLVENTVGSAVEGVFMSTGQVLGESAFGDNHEKLAEQLFFGGGMGALVGGAFGTVPTVIGAGIKKSSGWLFNRSKRFLPDEFNVSSVDDFLKKTEEEASLRASGVTTTAGRKALRRSGRLDPLDVAKPELEGAQRTSAKEFLTKHKIVEKGQSYEDVLNKISEHVDANGAAIESFYNKLDDAVAGPVVSARRIAQRIDDEVLKKAKEFASETDIAARAKKEIERFSELDDLMTFKHAWKERRGYDKMARYDRDPVRGTEVFKKIRRIIDDEIKQAAKPVAEKSLEKNAYAAFLRANDEFGVASDLYKIGIKRLDTVRSNRRLSLTDYQAGGFAGVAGGVVGGAVGSVAGPAGAAIGAGVGSTVGGIAGAIGNKVMRENYNQWAAATARQLRVKRMAWLERTANRATYDSAKHVDGLLSPKPKSVLAKAGDIAVGTARFTAYATKQGIFLKSVKEAAEHDADRSKYERRAKVIEDMAQNREKFASVAATAIEPFSEDAPNIAMGVVNTAQRGVDFLQSKLPRKNSGKYLLERIHKPSRSEVIKWNRYANAVSDPMSVVEALGNGTVTKEGLEAIKAVYPEVYTDVAVYVAAMVSGRNDLNSKQRRIVAMMFGGNVADASFTTVTPPQPEAPKPKKSLGQEVPRKSRKTKMVENTMTSAQRIGG